MSELTVDDIASLSSFSTVTEYLSISAFKSSVIANCKAPFDTCITLIISSELIKSPQEPSITFKLLIVIVPVEPSPTTKVSDVLLAKSTSIEYFTFSSEFIDRRL